MTQLVVVNQSFRELNDEQLKRLLAKRTPNGKSICGLCSIIGMYEVGYICTREKGHLGPHIAHSFDQVRAVWSKR